MTQLNMILMHSMFEAKSTAHEEWIFAHFGTKSNNVPDEKFISRLTKDLTVGGQP